MSSQTRRSAKKFSVVGDTYPVREKLKALGAVWEPVIRQWLFLEEPDGKTKKALKAMELSLVLIP